MLAEGYKETEIGVIPIEWEVELLDKLKFDISDGNYSSKYPKQSDFIKVGIPFIRANNIKNMTVIHKDMRYISVSQHNELKKGHLKKGDILITTRGDIGQIALVPDEFIDANINAQVVRIGASKRVYNKYLAYFLTQQHIQNIITSLETGTALKQLPVGKLGLIPISLPPLKEQEKIADILSTADKKIDAIASQIEMCETLKKGLLQKLLSEGIGHSEFKDSELGKIPKGWEVKSLSMIGSFSKGKGISKNEVIEDGIPCMRYAEIYTEYDIVLKNIKSFIDEKSVLNSKQLKQGDILFAGSGETLDDIGKSIAFLDEFEAYVGGDTIILSPKTKYNSLFMSYQLNSTLVRLQLRKLGQGSSIVHIYSSGLEKVKVPFPPLKEQKQIADILLTADEKLEVLRAKKQKYETLKIGLLQKLLSGEVRV